MHAQILADTDAVAGILRQTRSRPRKYESVTRRSQKLRVRNGSCVGDPGGVISRGYGPAPPGGAKQVSLLLFLSVNAARLRQI